MPSSKPEKGKPSATYQAAQRKAKATRAKALKGIRVVAATPEVMAVLEKSNPSYGYRGALLPDPVTLQRIADLARINATNKEIASALRVSEETFIRFKAQNPVVSEVLDAERGDGKVSLRRAQWRAAVDEGSVPMMIWLGKNELGQSDKAEVSHDVNVTVLRALMELGDD